MRSQGQPKTDSLQVGTSSYQYYEKVYIMYSQRQLKMVSLQVGMSSNQYYEKVVAYIM